LLIIIINNNDQSKNNIFTFGFITGCLNQPQRVSIGECGDLAGRENGTKGGSN
jgi:hypothetical protein